MLDCGRQETKNQQQINHKRKQKQTKPASNSSPYVVYVIERDKIYLQRICPVDLKPNSICFYPTISNYMLL
jgi:hypothetical protein